MLLREHLAEYTKEELLNEARNLELQKCSGLRKSALIDGIVEKFCTEEMLRTRLTCLTKEQMELFRQACVTPQDVSVNGIIDGIQLYRYWLGYFEEPTDKFSVFEDVAEVFSRIDDEAFRAEQNKKGWMMKCVHFFIDYYGIAPIEIIHEMYRLKVRCTIDEMTDMLWGMPVDIVESCIFPMEKLGIQNWPKDDPLYSSRGLFIHIPLLEDGKFEYLMEQQMDKEFYIPSAQQIEEICGIGYEASSLAYKKLESFLTKEMGIPYEQAVSWCLQVWGNSYEGDSPAEVINRMSEADVVFTGEKQINEFAGLLMTAHNNTRMKENRGHKPGELVRKEFKSRMPLDPESDADNISTTMLPKGLDGNTLKSEKKVYPNDPCPCGSGKKYKKCCGRN